MSNTHTAGPWRIDNGHHGLYVRAGKTSDPFGGEIVAQAFNAADARLIIKAPELLTMLERLTHPNADDSDLSDALDLIKQARGTA